MDTELLIEFMSGEDILWKSTGLVRSWDNPYIQLSDTHKWIDEDFKNKFINYFKNTSTEDFRESINFLKHSYYGIYSIANIVYLLLKVQ